MYLYDVPVSENPSSYTVLNEGAVFSRFFPPKLVNKGTGKNYGLEFTYEKFFSKTYFLLFTSSLYDSKYKGSDGVERNTVFNGNYAANLLGGLIFTLTENLMPGWVVYPILLLFGLGLLRSRAVTGALFLLGSASLFLLIYLPFTLFAGSIGNPCPNCSRTLLGVTLFIVPLVTAFVALMAWRQLRRHEIKLGE